MQLTYFAVSKTFPALKDAEYSFIRRGSGGGGGYLEKMLSTLLSEGDQVEEEVT